MRCVKNPSVVPPGRYSYDVPETQANITAGTLGRLVNSVARHYQANHKDVPENLGELIQDQICARPEAVNHCYECSEQGWTGLGDVIYSFANPIARAIDSVAGTNVAGCSGCSQRRKALNAVMPLR